MRRTFIHLLLASSIGAAGLAHGGGLPAATQPATSQPVTTQPAATQPAAMSIIPMTEPYRILLTRSIFARDAGRTAHQSRAGGADGPGGQGGPGGQAQPEAGLVLRGAVRDNGAYVAFIEDAASHIARRVKEGDTLALGRVGNINLRGIDYESGGKVTRVAMGQNLQGAVVLAPVPPPAATPAAGGPPKPPGPPQRPGGGPPAATNEGAPVANSQPAPADAERQPPQPPNPPGS